MFGWLTDARLPGQDVVGVAFGCCLGHICMPGDISRSRRSNRTPGSNEQCCPCCRRPPCAARATPPSPRPHSASAVSPPSAVSSSLHLHHRLHRLLARLSPPSLPPYSASPLSLRRCLLLAPPTPPSPRSALTVTTSSLHLRRRLLALPPPPSLLLTPPPPPRPHSTAEPPPRSAAGRTKMRRKEERSIFHGFTFSHSQNVFFFTLSSAPGHQPNTTSSDIPDQIKIIYFSDYLQTSLFRKHKNRGHQPMKRCASNLQGDEIRHFQKGTEARRKRLGPA